MFGRGFQFLRPSRQRSLDFSGSIGCPRGISRRKVRRVSKANHSNHRIGAPTGAIRPYPDSFSSNSRFQAPTSILFPNHRKKMHERVLPSSIAKRKRPLWKRPVFWVVLVLTVGAGIYLAERGPDPIAI